MMLVWPTVNAGLNLASFVCLLCGYLLIKRGKRKAHQRCMSGALVCSVIFLASYLAYHFIAGSQSFRAQGLVRPLYFCVLISHTVLAVSVVPMVLVTLRRALRGRFQAHRTIARWTLPIWLYVSLTGVVVYLMLYVFWP